LSYILDSGHRKAPGQSQKYAKKWKLHIGKKERGLSDWHLSAHTW